ncbi:MULTISPECIES: glutaminyl-peptide cyclotransferase [unclassified Halanaerobium]|uniref:glutaminyl-peptide cyclotransferase n=1 Tax=unclassified Halanaerobium TaxID=2641197 RepID=UPI000DF3D81A|nr:MULTISPECIES: glutaminyl-peptide cyclotransferase [unclassified Halanaerobium]RCW47713.1 glutamine cyclotransferase [Halanaerobium sp. MA284_MarDTE_T2]RCW84643.1 glutamine cyclotransferase [Halanaerobium sp. DL-01]
MKKTILLLIIITIFAAPSAVSAKIKSYSYKIINTYPHDSTAFTQGLEFFNGFLYESTGLYDKSSLKKINLNTGEILKIKKLPGNHFGEGITILNDKIYQLTWKAKTAYVYDLNFNLLKEFSYKGEGWGLTNDSQHLIMSNGSNKIYYRNPDNFSVLRTIEVAAYGEKISNINELEYINGEIFANIWFEDYILRINPESGEINSMINLSGIINPDNYLHEINVLNGIAYDEDTGRLFVTGKLWPHIFEIKIVE